MTMSKGVKFVENLEHCGFDPFSSYVAVLGTGAVGTAIYSQFILNGAEHLYVFNDSEALEDQAKKIIPVATSGSNGDFCRSRNNLLLCFCASDFSFL